MLEYKANLPDNDPFADFDKGFKAVRSPLNVEHPTLLEMQAPFQRDA
jgi:hypothetical protein